MALTAAEKRQIERLANQATNKVEAMTPSIRDAMRIVRQAERIISPLDAANKAADAKVEAQRIETLLTRAGLDAASIWSASDVASASAIASQITTLCEQASGALGNAEALLDEATAITSEPGKIESVVETAQNLRDEIKTSYDGLKNQAKNAEGFATTAKAYSDKVAELRPGSPEDTAAAQAAANSSTAAKAGRKVVSSRAAATDSVVKRLASIDRSLDEAKDIMYGATPGNLADVNALLTKIRQDRDAVRKLSEAFSNHYDDAESERDNAKTILDGIPAPTVRPPIEEVEKTKKALLANWLTVTFTALALIMALVASFQGGFTVTATVVLLVAIPVTVLAKKGKNALLVACAAFALMMAAFSGVDFGAIPGIGKFIVEQEQTSGSKTECRTGWANDPCATLEHKVAASPIFWVFATLTIATAVGLIVWKLKLAGRLSALWQSCWSRVSALRP